MSTVDMRVMSRIQGHVRSARGLITGPRFWIYVSCTALAVLVSYLLGKEMMWDTLDYHLYAGFSALHDRFGHDYFAAGAQSYFSPYLYVPFYALVRMGLPALWIASALAIAQSVTLWLTYELAVAVCPPDDSRLRIVAGACAALLALANPILIDELGSSYSDITTAVIVLAGWLLLVHALRAPSAKRVVCAGLLLGAASALKLTNSLHALSACVLLPFLSATWNRKARLILSYIVAVAVSFAAVTAPWAVRLDHYFGNPFFPLLNNVFHSPYFPVVSPVDYRFMPSSFLEALWRPFAIALPVSMVDIEDPSPDIRYALLLTLALVVLARFAWQRIAHGRELRVSFEAPRETRALLALGCAFVVDWVLWLRISGNGRYFLSMACVAGVLSVVLACRTFAARPRILVLLLGSAFAVQALQLAVGTHYRTSVPWDGGAWFEVAAPPALKTDSDLYFLMGEQSESFIAPFLGKGSAFVNVDGDFALGPNGKNGARIQSLIREYAAHIRVIAMVAGYDLTHTTELPDASHVNGTLALFGLRADTTDCAAITVKNMRPRWQYIVLSVLPVNTQIQLGLIRMPMSPDGRLVTCRVVPDAAARLALANAEREPDLVFDRMEDQCPQLFQPPRPVTEVYGDGHKGYQWVRKYQGTNLTALISGGFLRFVDGTRGGKPDMLGSESDWVRAPEPLACERHGEHYYARIVRSAR